VKSIDHANNDVKPSFKQISCNYYSTIKGLNKNLAPAAFQRQLWLQLQFIVWPGGIA